MTEEEYLYIMGLIDDYWFKIVNFCSSHSDSDYDKMHQTKEDISNYLLKLRDYSKD